MGMFSKIELEIISTSEWIGDYRTQLNLKLSSASSHFFLTQLIVTAYVSNLPGRCPKPSLLPAQVINHSNVLILFVRETVYQTWGLHNLNFFLNFLQASLSSGEGAFGFTQCPVPVFHSVLTCNIFFCCSICL